MTTAQAWIEQTRSHLLSGYSEMLNQLSLPYTAGSGTLTFEYDMGGIRPGAKISIGLNNFYVWGVTGQTATVTAAQDGSTDADAASGAIVQVAPRFTDFAIWNALSSDLADLSGPSNGLFAIGTVDFTYQAQYQGYDLGSIASTLIDGFEVKYLTSGNARDTPRLPKSEWRINRNVDTSLFASGCSLEIFSSASQGNSVRLTYKKSFTMPTATTDDLATTGMLPSAYDLPPMGAAIALMAGREIKRNFIESMGESRRATEVPPGAVAQSANGLKQRRLQRIVAEVTRLNSAYPAYRS
jgi:hypothetical protein